MVDHIFFQCFQFLLKCVSREVVKVRLIYQNHLDKYLV